MNRSAEYLVVLYAVEQRRPPPTAPRVVADALDRSPAATTEMFARLADRDLVVHEPYVGVTLTDGGRAVAADLHDRYATLVHFFRDVLDLAEPEAEALRIVDGVSGTVADRLAATVLDQDADRPDPDAALLAAAPEFR